MRNVDWKKFTFATVFRTLAIGAVLGAAIGITALIAPAAIPAVALWGGVGGVAVLGTSLAISVSAANAEADMDWECRDLYELPKPSAWAKLEMGLYDKLENMFTSSKSEDQTHKPKFSRKSKLSLESKQTIEQEEKIEEKQIDVSDVKENDGMER